MRSRQYYPIEFEPLLEPKITATESPLSLESSHLQTLHHAVTNILQTGLAEKTYSQIVDGLPTTESFCEFHSLWETDDHPAQLHECLCDGIIEKTRAFRDDFNMDSLTFEPQLLESFQNSTPGSQAFKLALIELVAVSCHQIAVFLFQNERASHKGEYESWLEKEDGLAAKASDKYQFTPKEPSVPFYHNSYLLHQQYPYGIADVVGYWAEAKIFGGVVLFDRSNINGEFKSVYFHESLLQGPQTIYPLLPEQFESLAAFLLSDEISPCPLPMHATKLNRPRYDPYHAMKYFSIYRDRYERRLPLTLQGGDTSNSTDYPEIADQLWLWQHLDDVEAGIAALDEKEVTEVKQRLNIITPSSPHWGFDGRFM